MNGSFLPRASLDLSVAIRYNSSKLPALCLAKRGPMNFLAAPILFVMTYITYQQSAPLCSVPGEYGFLSSMWLMYAVMGVIHSGPWWSLTRALWKAGKLGLAQK